MNIEYIFSLLVLGIYWEGGGKKWLHYFFSKLQIVILISVIISFIPLLYFTELLFVWKSNITLNFAGIFSDIMLFCGWRWYYLCKKRKFTGNESVFSQVTISGNISVFIYFYMHIILYFLFKILFHTHLFMQAIQISLDGLEDCDCYIKCQLLEKHLLGHTLIAEVKR